MGDPGLKKRHAGFFSFSQQILAEVPSGNDGNWLLQRNGNRALIGKVYRHPIDRVARQVRFEDLELRQSLCCDASAAGLFPGRLRIDQRNRMAEASEKYGRPRTCWACSDDGYLHVFTNIECFEPSMLTEELEHD